MQCAPMDFEQERNTIAKTVRESKTDRECGEDDSHDEVGREWNASECICVGRRKGGGGGGGGGGGLRTIVIMRGTDRDDRYR